MGIDLACTCCLAIPPAILWLGHIFSAKAYDRFMAARYSVI